jgi:hypothetical protein
LFIRAIAVRFLIGMDQAVDKGFNSKKVRLRLVSGKVGRGRPQRRSTTPLGNLILRTMKLLGLSYKEIVSESERLARVNNNPDLRIGKSTIGNIIGGSIRQPGPAKLDSLRMILNLSRAEIEAAIGLQTDGRFAGYLETTRARTYELPLDVVTRQRIIKLPCMGEDANLEHTRFFEASVEWANIEVEYLASFYLPHLCYVVIGEEDANASPLTPAGSRLLVNKLLTEVHAANDLSFHQRELFYVLTPHGFTCVYAELVQPDTIVLIPHPDSGNVREEFHRDEVTIIGQVVGVLYPR